MKRSELREVYNDLKYLAEDINNAKITEDDEKIVAGITSLIHGIEEMLNDFCNDN